MLMVVVMPRVRRELRVRGHVGDAQAADARGTGQQLDGHAVERLRR